MALGAGRSSVLRLVLGRAFIVVTIGVALGLIAAVALAPRVSPTLLPNVNARDPLTFATTAMVLVTVALIANYLPARRATRIDPLIALKGE